MKNLELVMESGIGILRVTGWPEYVTAGFSTRQGGISSDPYSTLNLSFGVGDTRASVLENRRRLARVVGLPLRRWVFAQQVHGNQVAMVNQKAAGRGAEGAEDSLSGTDAMVSEASDLVLAACFADCVPLLFFSSKPAAVGVAHAGWRGTVSGIAAATAGAFHLKLGVDPSNLLVAIGPHIGPCCYTVGEEVVEGLNRLLGLEAGAVAVKDGTTWRVDLGMANALALRQWGLSEKQISVFFNCTCCHSDLFFSHRSAGGPSGRFSAFITLASSAG